MIYLDNAATTRPPAPLALDAMRTALEDAWGNPSALYRPGQQARKLVEDARRTVAAYCTPRARRKSPLPAAAPNPTYGLYTPVPPWALPQANGTSFPPRSSTTPCCILYRRCKRRGFTVTLLPPSAAGLITPQQLADALQPDTCLVQHHVCQQRNRHRAAHCGTALCRGARRAVPH